MADLQQTWCQPGDQPRRQFIVLFDDVEKEMAVFDDEEEARAFWKQASLEWNCYLFAAMPRQPETPVAATEASETVSVLCDLHENLLRAIDEKTGFKMFWAKELSEMARTVLDAATKLDRLGRQLEDLRRHRDFPDIRPQSVNITGSVWMAIMNCPHEETEDEVTLKFDPKQPGATARSQMTTRLSRELERFVIRHPGEEGKLAEAMMRIGEELGLDHVTAYNCIDAIRILKRSANKQRARNPDTMADLQALKRAVSTAETRLDSYLEGFRHASSASIVREINNLMDAKIALALVSLTAHTPSFEERLQEALNDLVVGCSGEVEEVFRGEIGSAVSKARRLLGEYAAASRAAERPADE